MCELLDRFHFPVLNPQLRFDRGSSAEALAIARWEAASVAAVERESQQRGLFYQEMVMRDGLSDITRLSAWAKRGVPPELRPRVWR